MDQSSIAVRYAKALFETAVEKNILDTLKKDIGLVAQTCSDEAMQQLIESPVCKPSDKIKAFESIFGGKVDVLTINFLKMVISNKRESHIPAICRNFASRYYRHANIKQAHIITASAIDNATKEKMQASIAKLFNSNIELTTAEDENLIGGFVMRIDDQQFDASVSTKLRKIKQQLTESTIN